MKYLDGLEAYTFNGYAKVGDNTWPNLAALLTGYRPQHTKTVLNEGPFIWKDMSPCLVKITPYFHRFWVLLTNQLNIT